MSKRLDYNQIAPEGLEALGGVHGYIAESSLPATLVDLVYLRVSQIIDCAYSLDAHTRGLLGRGKASRSWRRPGKRGRIRFWKLPHGSWHEMSHGFFQRCKNFHQRDK